MMRKIALVAVAAATFGNPALAQDLVYTPTNPSFGGNPGYSGHLLGTASAQRTATARTSSRADPITGDPGVGDSDADLFVRQLQGRLLSALAAQVTEAIFGADPQESGTVIFGETGIEFFRTPEAITLRITNNVDGTLTEIVVPQLVVN